MNEVNRYLEKIKQLHKANPKIVEDELPRLVDELEAKVGPITLSKEENEALNLMNDLDLKRNMHYLFLMVEIIIIILLGIPILLSGGEVSFLYYFGLIFFLAGEFVGLSQPVFGLIFLVSHGFTGLGMMIGSIFSSGFDMAIFSDLSLKTGNLFILGIALIVVAILGTILHNLSSALKKKKMIMPIILGLYILGLLCFIIFNGHIM